MSKRAWKLDLHLESALELKTYKKKVRGKILVYRNNASSAS
jgi:hypothetical protein